MPRVRKQKGPGRPRKDPQDQVQRIACYVEPRVHGVLERQAEKTEEKTLPKYAKRVLTQLADALEQEEKRKRKS